MSTVDAQRLIQMEMGRDGNKVCAECFAPNPNFVSVNLGVFVCQKCSKYHKRLPPDRNNVVDVRSQLWTPDVVSFIRSKGNVVVNNEFEKYLPKYYHRPDPDDPPIIREQWIKAKYEREEFKDISKQEGYSKGSKIGSLYKRGKDNEKFLLRKFVLKEPEGILEYFIKYSDRVPKDTITIRNLVNVYMLPEKIGNVNGMQIIYEKDGIRRNLFVYGENGKTSSDWYHALRASMVKHKFQNFPDTQMKRYLNTKILREGWMSKTGPKRLEKFRKRWFSLVGTMIWYYVNPLDAHPLGFIHLGSRTFGYGVMKGLPQGIKIDGYGLTVHTPERVYALNCSTLESRDKWVDCITSVLDSCTTVWSQPQVGRLGSEHDTKAKKEDPDPYTFADLSNKYRPSSDSDVSSNQDTADASSQQRTPLFEKKANRPAHDKYAKKQSKKRQSTKKLQQQTTATNGDINCAEPVVASTISKSESKKYSDDSDDQFDDEEVAMRFNMSSDSLDSDEDLVEDLTNVKVGNKKNEEGGSMSNLLELSSETKSKRMSRDDMSDDDGLRNNKSENDKPPKKPPRQRRIQQEQSESALSDADSSGEQKTQTNATLAKAQTSSDYSAVPSKSGTDSRSYPDSAQLSPPPILPDRDENTEWKKRTFSSVRRVQGNDRASLKKDVGVVRQPSMTNMTPSSVSAEVKEIKPRPVDITLTNQMKEDCWFMVFQGEDDPDPKDSYMTPWVGAQIAEAPASVGPIRVPTDIEIAVIDTAPGGFGLQRTTGPFYAEEGDVWEVEIMSDKGGAPEMFYHEGMETDDGSIMVYACVSNAKKFEVAVFKSGRKLFSRKGVKPGEAVNLRIKPVLYFLSVDEENYYDMEGMDVPAQECIAKSDCIDINYKQPRMKVAAKKRGDSVFFTRYSPKSTTARVVSIRNTSISIP